VVAPWDRRDEGERLRIEQVGLVRWLPTVVAAAPFHAARATGIDPRSLRDRRGLQRLPPTRERDLLGDGVAGASAVLRPTEAQVKAGADEHVIAAIVRSIRRDGAGGKRDAIVREYRPLQLHRGGVDGQLLVASSRSDLDRMHRAGARAAAVLGLRDDDVVVSLVPAGPTLDHLGTVHLAAGAGLTAFHPRGAGSDLDAAVAATSLLAPSVLVVPVDEAVDAAEAARSAGAPSGALRCVLTVGPPPTVEVRAAIGDAFARAGARSGVAVRALWGPSACRALWAECEAGGGGLHTYPDLEVLEVLDPLTGAATTHDGDLTLTSLGWHGTAHVRFQTGAWVDPLATDPCPGCGRTVPRVVGAVEPHAWELPVATGDGSRTTVDLRGIAAAVADAPWVTSWRAELRPPAVATGDDRLEVHLAGATSDDRALELAERLVAATGVPVEVVLAGGDDEVSRGVAAAGGILADRR
jgi:hypothetical protein